MGRISAKCAEMDSLAAKGQVNQQRLGIAPGWRFPCRSCWSMQPVRTRRGPRPSRRIRVNNLEFMGIVSVGDVLPAPVKKPSSLRFTGNEFAELPDITARQKF